MSKQQGRERIGGTRKGRWGLWRSQLGPGGRQLGAAASGWLLRLLGRGLVLQHALQVCMGVRRWGRQRVGLVHQCARGTAAVLWH